MSKSRYCIVSKEILLFFKWMSEEAVKKNSDLFKNFVKNEWNNGFKEFYKKLILQEKKISDEELNDSLLKYFKEIELAIGLILENQKKEEIKNTESLKRDYFAKFDIENDVKSDLIKKIKKKISNEKEEAEFFKTVLNKWKPKNLVIN